MDREDFKRKYDPAPRDMSQQEYIHKLEEENNRLKRQVGTDERLFDYVRDSIERFESPEPVEYKKPKLSHDEVYASLMLTDTHAEELVRAEEMEGLAEYNWDIFEVRMQKTAKKVLELVNIMRQASAIHYLDINCLGDWFTGKIQPQEEGYGHSLTMPVAVPRVSYIFGQVVRGLSAHFDRVRVNCICGNHGRDTVKPAYKMTSDRNWDMSVYLSAQYHTIQCQNIEWNIPRAITTVVDVLGWKSLLSHSLEVSMTHRTPYYPIETTVDMEHKARAGTDKDFKYVFLGHYHHHAVLDNDIVLCPCMIGANQYSRFKLHKRSDAAQLLCFFTEKHGLINQWPIKL